MTPEKQTKDPNAQKQKIIIGIIVVVVLIVLWQFMGLGGGGGSAPTPTPTPVASAPMKVTGNAMQAPTAPAANMMATPSAAAPASEIAPPKQEKVAMNAELSKLQQQTQTEYVSSLNKLQMLKLQREIDETKTAIATAELNRMTAEKNIADLITAKQDITPEAAPANTGITTPAPPPIQSAAPAPEFPYTVMSVSFEGRKWAAVLGAPGTPSAGTPAAGTTPGTTRLFTVGIGDTLPPDSSIVVTIDKQGVTVKKGMTTRFIPLSTSTAM